MQVISWIIGITAVVLLIYYIYVLMGGDRQ